MSSSKTKKLSRLSESLDALEAKLEPLLSQSLVETAAGLDTMQEAKLHTVLPYLVNDLIFIYLRTRGVDPKTHPVINELERVRQYFEKIKESENKQQRRTEVDKAAATRFIKHAIAQSQQPAQEVPADERKSEAGPSRPPTIAPVHVTDKMRERKKYLNELREQDENNDEEPLLEVIDDDKNENIQPPQKSEKASTEAFKTGAVGSKKRRKAMDPFASLEAPSPAPSSSGESPAPASAEDNSGRSKKRRRKKGALTQEK